MAVPKLRFKEFKDEYNTYKLNDIVDFYKGNTLSKSDIKESGKFPCILYGELYTKYNEITDKVISYTDRSDKNLFYSKINDVLIPCSGETALDISTSTCILQDHVILGGDLNVLRPKIQSGKYLSYLLSNKKRLIIAKYAQGDSIVHLYGEKIKNINIDLPTIEEQEKVSKLLELLNKKIELQKQKIEALKIYKTGLIEKYFDCKNGEKTKISEILEEVTNKTTENNQYDVISSTKDGLFLQKEYFNRNIASDDNSGYKILKKNQIVFSPQNLWMGNINYNNKYEIGIVSPSYKVFDVNKKFDKDYISYLLKTNKAIYYYTINSEQGASIVRRNLNIESFYEINFIIPDILEQEQKGNLINKISSKIENEENKYKELNKLKKGLLQKMFI